MLCSLHDNNIGDKGASALAAVLKETRISQLKCAAAPIVFAFMSAPVDTLTLPPSSLRPLFAVSNSTRSEPRALLRSLHPSSSMVTPVDRPDHRRDRHDRAIPSAEPPCPEAASSSTAQTSMSARARRASASPSRPIPSEHATAKHCTCTGLHTGTLRG